MVWLCSADTRYRGFWLAARVLPSLFGFSLLLMLPGCVVTPESARYECENVRSDRERGVVSTAWVDCEKWEKKRVDDARKIVEEAEKKSQKP